MGFQGSEGLYASDVYELARGLLDALDAVKVNDRTSREAALHPLLATWSQQATAQATAKVRNVERKAIEQEASAAINRNRYEQTIKGLREQLDAATSAKALAWDHYAASALGALIVTNEKKKPRRRRMHDELVTEAAQLAELLSAEAEGRGAR